MSNQLFRDDSFLLGHVMLQVGADGQVPVNLVEARALGASCAVEAAAHRLDQGICEFAFQVIDDFADNVARCVFCFFGDYFTECEQGSDEMDIGVDRLQDFWFHQHLDMVWASGGDRRIEKAFARVSGLPYHPMPQLAGSALLWFTAARKASMAGWAWRTAT